MTPGSLIWLLNWPVTNMASCLLIFPGHLNLIFCNVTGKRDYFHICTKCSTLASRSPSGSSGGISVLESYTWNLLKDMCVRSKFALMDNFLCNYAFAFLDASEHPLDGLFHNGTLCYERHEILILKQKLLYPPWENNF